MILKKLIITGSGIKSLSHLTRESEIAIEQANLVLYLVNEPIMAQWIQDKAKHCESLDDLYFSEELRSSAYIKIVEKVISSINQYNKICMVVYGHPLMLSNSVTHLIQCIDRTAIELTILPAISSFDCLLADLEIDPYTGCFAVEVNELINKDKYIDTTAHIMIWQIGMIDDRYTYENKNSTSSLKSLKDKLIKSYDLAHECILYEASIYPHIPSKKINVLFLFYM